MYFFVWGRELHLPPVRSSAGTESGTDTSHPESWQGLSRNRYYLLKKCGILEKMLHSLVVQARYALYAEHNIKGRIKLAGGTHFFAPTQGRNAWGHKDAFKRWKMADGSPITGANVFSEGNPFAQGGRVRLTLELQPH